MQFRTKSTRKHFWNAQIWCLMPWLHQGPDSQTKSCQTEPDKKLLVLSGFLDQKLEGKLKEAGQIEPDNTRFCLFCKQSKILTLSGTIWPTSFKFPANFWSRKPDRTSNFFIWLRLAWFCLAVWAWCSQSIKLTELKLSALPNFVNPGKNLLKNIR